MRLLGKKYIARALSFLLLTSLIIPVFGAEQLKNQQKFNIETAPLAESLLVFSKQTGLQILFSSDDVANLSSPQIRGYKTRQTVLNELLSDTNLIFELIDENTIIIKRKPAQKTEETRQEENITDVIDEIVVTGSWIPGSPAIYSTSNLTQISRINLERNGVSSIEEIFPFVSYNSGSEFQVNSLTQPFSSGTVSLNLRNLGIGSTLMLVNGRRVTLTPSVTTEGSSFVDIAALLPLSAIEKVELFKDGASATYGSDAVAGVVNFITYRDYEGGKIRYQHSKLSPGKDQRQLSVTQGVETEHIKGLISFSVSDQEPLYTSERSFTEGTAISKQGQPATYQLPDGTLVRDPNCGITGGFISETGHCAFDYSGFFNLREKKSKRQFFSTLEYTPNDNVRGYLDIGANRSRIETIASPSFPFAISFPIVPTDNPGNIFGQPVAFLGRVLGAESPASKAVHHYNNFFIATSADVRLNEDWFYNVSLSYSASNLDYDRTDTLITPLMEALSGRGGPNQNEYWNPLHLAENSPQVVKGLFGSTDLEADTSLLSLETILHGEIRLPWVSNLRSAIGIAYRAEELDHDWGDAYNASELVALGGGPDYRGRREVFSLFSEFIFPLQQNFLVQLSNRFEQYAGGDNSFVPKLAILYEFTNTFSLRSSVGTGLRAPSLFQQTANQTTQANIFDTKTGIDVFRSVKAQGNPELQNETSKTFSLDLIWAPSENANLSLGYWWYEYKDIVIKELPEDIVAQAFRDEQAGLSGTTAQRKVERDPVTGLITTVSVDFVNAASVMTNGFDVGIKTISPLERLGTLEFGSFWTYINQYKLQQDDNSPTVNAAGNRNTTNFAHSMPQLKGSTFLNLVIPPITASLAALYTSRYDDDGNPGEDIASHTTIDVRLSADLQLQKQRGPTLSLAVGIKNIFDKRPPRVETLLGYDSLVHNPTGRLAYFEAAYHY